MVTTRSATNSLPKKSLDPEPPATITKPKRSTSTKKTPTAKKTPAKKSAAKGPATKKPTTKSPAVKKEPQTTPSSTPPKRTPPTSNPSQQTSGLTFLDLPPEIRNEIYALTFNTSRRIMIKQSQTRMKEPALVAVSQQIRAEALAMWYSEQVFEIQGSSPAVKFLRFLSDEKLSLLRTVHIQVTVISSIEYARTRILQLMKEFGPRGLRKQTLLFQVIQGGSLVWASVGDLEGMVEDEAQRPSAAALFAMQHAGSSTGW